VTAAKEGPGRGEGLAALVTASAVLPVFLALPVLALVTSLSPAAVVEHLRGETAVRALWLTLRTTAVATLAIVAAGTPLAYLLARRSFRGRTVLDTLIDLPVTIPPVVAGVALLLAFGRRGLVGRSLEAAGFTIPFTTVAVVLAQVFMASPFYVKAARAGFAAVDAHLESAARTLGASPWRAFRTVTLPLAAPALLAGTVLAWARALSEFGATMMFAGNLPGRTQTLTLAVMTAMESDVDTAVAVSTLALGLAAAALLGARALARRWAPDHA
jgi:molybdate transport system permease protein